MSYSASSMAWAAREADRPWASREYREAVGSLGRAAVARGEAPIDAHMPDSAIRQRAQDRADTMRREIEGIEVPMGAHQAADWLRARVAALGASKPFIWPGCEQGKPPEPGTLAPMYERAMCPMWWRRQLRRAVVKAREVEAMHAGEVRRAGQTYCTDDTAERRALRTAANAEMLEATTIEDAAGQKITLAQAAAASTANKSIRRGELMTRIKGCEQAGEALGMVGMFSTHTLASRWHPQRWEGGRNPRHDGTDGPMQPNDPRAGQGQHRATWAKCRAKLARLGVRFFGFRVAEPHHDGCTHWHMLLWVHPAQADMLAATMRDAWLEQSPHEPGAQAHRFTHKRMDAGGAIAYMAKYISKGIDDAGAVGTEGHKDTDEQGQSDWVGTGKAQRVEAWAAAWGIRQFQAIGQPPVTVWRELRRIDAERVKGAEPEVIAAHAAVQRDGERRASWHKYMAAQGGPMGGRGYPVRLLRSDTEQEPGKYGDPRPAKIIGVAHAAVPEEWILSDRREWRPVGTWARASGWTPGPPKVERMPGVGVGLRAFDLPRTRVNNCTQIDSKIQPEGAPLRTWLQILEARGGSKERHEQFPEFSGRQSQQRGQRDARTSGQRSQR